MDFILLIMQAFYIMLPSYFANMAPVVFRNRLNFLAKPLDMGIELNNKRIFGDNKTVRGLVVGVIASLLVAFLQFLLYNVDFFRSISIINYENWILIGVILGLGAIIGDAGESFFKRRLNIDPGKPWIPFDQTDFCFGAFLLLIFFADITFEIFIAALILTFFLHIIVNHAAYYLKIRKQKW